MVFFVVNYFSFRPFTGKLPYRCFKSRELGNCVYRGFPDLMSLLRHTCHDRHNKRKRAPKGMAQKESKKETAVRKKRKMETGGKRCAAISVLQNDFWDQQTSSALTATRRMKAGAACWKRLPFGHSQNTTKSHPIFQDFSYRKMTFGSYIQNSAENFEIILWIPITKHTYVTKYKASIFKVCGYYAGRRRNLM